MTNIFAQGYGRMSVDNRGQVCGELLYDCWSSCALAVANSGMLRCFVGWSSCGVWLADLGAGGASSRCCDLAFWGWPVSGFATSLACGLVSPAALATALQLHLRLHSLRAPKVSAGVQAGASRGYGPGLSGRCFLVWFGLGWLLRGSGFPVLAGGAFRLADAAFFVCSCVAPCSLLLRLFPSEASRAPHIQTSSRLLPSFFLPSNRWLVFLLFWRAGGTGSCF